MKSTKSRSVLWAWAGSYIIVLFIPFISVFINYGINMATIKQGIISANELTLNNIGDSIDNYLKAEKEFFRHIVNQSNYQLLQYYDQLNNYFYYDVLQVYEAMDIYSSNSVTEMHCMISLEELDYVISDQTTNKSSLYYNSLQQYHPDMPEYETWKSMLQATYTNQYLIAKDPLSGEEYSLIFANTFGSELCGNINIFVCMPLTEINKLVEYLPSEVYLVLNIEGMPQTIFNRDGFEIAAEKQGGLQEVFGDAEWVSLVSDSAESKLSYELVFSEDYLWEELGYTRRMFSMNVIVTLIFGIMGTIFLLKRNYQPVQELLKETEGEGISGNEFQEITNAYQKQKTENVTYRKLLADQKEELKGSWLLSMMKGRTTSLQRRERESYFDLSIKGNIAMVGFMIPMSDSNDIKYDELLFFVVDNIFQELMNRFPSHRVEDGRFLLYLFDLQAVSEDEWQQLAMEKVEYLCDLLEEKWKTLLIGVVSDAEEEFDNVRFLYKKVMETFEYQSVMGGFGAISTRTLDSQAEGNQLMEYVRDELNDFLKEGNHEGAMEVVEHFLARQKKVPFLTIKMHAFDIFNMISEVFRDYENDSAESAVVFHYAELLMQAGSIEAQKEVFAKLLEFVCDRIIFQVRTESIGIVDQVKKYVMENYQELNMNISTIAEHMHRSSKYISRVFKEETGEGILDYINQFRINRAKEIMSVRKCTMESLAEQVGYANVKSFRRAFVKITGDIPSKYMGQ